MENRVSSNYKSFQLRLEKRFSKGLSGMLSYTLGEAITDAPDHISTSGGGAGIDTGVRFRCRMPATQLRPGSSIPAPRVESSTHVMTLGLSSSLDDAMQATTNMIDWLMGRYELTLPEVPKVVGTSAEYRLSVVVGRNAGIVIKLHKDRLRLLKPRG